MTRAARQLVLGLDIGGTSTRAVVADTDGERHGSGHAGGANLTSHAPEQAFAALIAALGEALSAVDPADVVAAVIGSAGDRNLAAPAAAEQLATTWRSAGLVCPYEVVPDVAVAFAAGSAAPDGTLVLAGTGAAAVRMRDHRLDHAVDAHGWLLGDLGSAFWIGREAVRSTLRGFDEQRAPGPLGRAVLAAVTGTDEVMVNRARAADLVHGVHARPPVALAELAPLVSDLAGRDPEADRIVGAAADHLLHSVSLARSPGESTPIVLAGGLLVADTPVARLVVAAVGERWPAAEVSRAGDGAAGAAWLAAVGLGGLGATAATALHARLLG